MGCLRIGEAYVAAAACPEPGRPEAPGRCPPFSCRPGPWQGARRASFASRAKGRRARPERNFSPAPPSWPPQAVDWP